MTPRVYDALVEQRKAFIEKFGRESGPDPFFFDPDKDVPTPIDPGDSQPAVGRPPGNPKRG
jgi:hypothetical protein